MCRGVKERENNLNQELDLASDFIRELVNVLPRSYVCLALLFFVKAKFFPNV